MLEGYYRIETRRPAPPPVGADARGAANVEGAAVEAAGAPPPTPQVPRDVETYFRNARILIPTEALTAYTAFIGMAADRRQPGEKICTAEIFVGVTFLVVTILLRAIGSRRSGDDSGGGIQFTPAILSALAYILIVYASGGQLLYDQTHRDQALIANVLAVALGIMAPVIAPKFMAWVESENAKVETARKAAAEKAVEEAKSAAATAATLALEASEHAKKAREAIDAAEKAAALAREAASAADATDELKAEAQTKAAAAETTRTEAKKAVEAEKKALASKAEADRKLVDAEFKLREITGT